MASRSSKQQNVSKAQVVLPKLESDIKGKGTKDLQKEMDLEMEKMMEKQLNDNFR